MAAPAAGPGGPRVRFAPSPTGYFHVGSARTALFNWLFARRQAGTFLLRIEDTDAARNRPEWVDGILDALAWLGLAPDEAPTFQSGRHDRHTAAVDELWAQGRLYACECTREEVASRTADNAVPGYDGRCRDRGLDRAGHALRFRVPDEGTTVLDDVVRGRIEFPNAAIEDFVVVKSDGQPLFVLANAVDDAEMGVTHVIRGEDLLPSTPKQVLLWSAWRPDMPPPVFAHLPMLVNEQRKKLSKRRDPVAVEDYRDQGYLPEAFVNYLSLLGWSPPGDREVLALEEVVAAFRLEDVNHSPAFFDVKKLRHMNAEYIRAMAAADFVDRSLPWLEQAAFPRFDRAVFERIAPLVQERVSVLGEVPGMVDFLFRDEPVVDESAWSTVVADPGAGALLDQVAAALAASTWTAADLHTATAAVAESAGRKLGKAQAPVRVAVTGRRVGPPLFESMELLGRTATLERIEAARRRLPAA